MDWGMGSLVRRRGIYFQFSARPRTRRRRQLLRFRAGRAARSLPS